MSKNRFVSNKTKRVELSDGDWIEVKESLSWEEFTPLQKRFADKDPSAIFDLFDLVVKDWSFVDEKTSIVPLTPENVRKLEILTLNEISEVLIGMYLPKKKSSVELLRE
jgi:hypothetical protein